MEAAVRKTLIESVAALGMVSLMCARSWSSGAVTQSTTAPVGTYRDSVRSHATRTKRVERTGSGAGWGSGSGAG